MTPQPPNPRSVFGRAVELESAAERKAYLAEACAGAPDVRERVEVLLRAHEAAGGFLQPAAAGSAETVSYAPSPEPTNMVGQYKLLEKIGEGGMGEVWVADQMEPIKRRVALKLIKPGMDSRGVLARFEAERQALAVMDHPNIAKVLDAGTTPDGRPYFVMELVKGTPITEFCDVRKLTPKERLELFVPVCQAIQHAHMKGIIHRDIKPSNVLVELYDDKAVAKVIDFGVAKAIGQRLTEKTIYTGFGALVGTPTYMAPEQATFNALDVDTRADVYALGVLLYELLAGSPPIERDRLDKAALDEVLRIVRDEEPVRPSQRLSTSQSKATIAATRQSEPAALSQMMKGELDWIVMKALEKDRTRRYDTATALAKDVQRYLTGDSVEACPPTLGYRLRKVYRRNQAALTTAVVVAAALLVGLLASIWQATEARRSEARAVVERDDKEKALHAEAEQRTAAETARQGMQVERDAANVARAELRKTLYATAVSLLPATWKAGHGGRAAELLDGLKPGAGESDLRHFEWHYWDRVVRPHVREVPLDGYRFPLRLSGDGRVGVFGRSQAGNRETRELAVVELASGTALRSIPFSEPRLVRLVLDHAGRRALGGFVGLNGEGEAKVVAWDLTDGRVLHEESCPDLRSVSPRIVLSADGRTAATVRGATGVVRVESSKPEVRIVGLDPPGTELASVPYEAQQGDELETAVFSPNGGLFAVTTVNSRPAFAGPFGDSKVPPHLVKLQLLDVAKKATLRTVKLEGRQSCIAFTPEGKKLVAVVDSPRRVVVWDIQQDGVLKELCNTPLNSPDWEGASSYALALSPDGKTVAVASPQSPTVHLLDVDTGVLRGTLTGYGTMRSLTFNADGTRVSAVCHRVNTNSDSLTLQEWDLPTGNAHRSELDANQPPRERTLVSPDGKRRAVYQPIEGKVAVLDAGGKQLCSILVAPAHVYYTNRGMQQKHWRVNELTFGPNGRFLLVNSARSGAEVFDTETGTVRWKAPTPDNPVWSPFVATATVSSGGRTLALPEADAVRVVSFDDFRELTRIPVANLDRAYFSPDGRRVACVARRSLSNDTKTVEQVALWDLAADPPREVRTLKFGPWRLVFSPDGTRFATIGSPGRGEVWDSATGERVCQFDAGSNSSGMVFHPSGERFVIWQRSRTAGLQDLPAVTDARTGRIHFRLEGLAGDVSSAVYSPDGKRIAAVSNQNGKDCDVKLWDAESGRELLSLTATGAKGSGLNFRPTLEFSPDGQRLTLHLEGGEYAWDATPRRESR